MADVAVEAAITDVYSELFAGEVTPFINATATYTVNGGSRMLPEVANSMHSANLSHVSLPALNHAASQTIAGLLQVPAAMVTSGASGAIALASAACCVGTDPELMQAIPDLSGCHRNQFLVDSNLPTGYDQAGRLCGATRIEVSSLPEMEAALTGGHVAFVLLMADRFSPPSEVTWLTLAEVAPLAHAHGAVVVVDAAADFPLIPNPYLSLGADLVTHSCGKILRGPQGGGLLLGADPELVKAAAAHGSPNHAFGRPLKVGREISVGVVAAVKHWIEVRDIEAEYAEWRGWWRHVDTVLAQLPGVTTEEGPPVTADSN